MKTFHKSLTVLSLSLGLVLGSAVPLAAGGFQDYGGYHDRNRPEDLRGLIDRTQNDLRAAQEMEHNNDKQRDRYKNAQVNLSHLDRSIVREKFDKDALKKSVDDLKDILKNNTLQPSTRDALTSDLEGLQMVRERRY